MNYLIDDIIEQLKKHGYLVFEDESELKEHISENMFGENKILISSNLNLLDREKDDLDIWICTKEKAQEMLDEIKMYMEDERIKKELEEKE